MSERAVLWTVALVSLLVPLNSTMIAVALPTIVDDFGTSLGSASWLVTAYLIAMAALQPVTGRLGDRYGRRPLVLGGLVWFAVASAGAALGPSLELLVAFRVQQAVAGALFFPNAMALLRETVPEERLGSRMGLLGAGITLGAAAGPPLGGALVSFGGWEWIFLVNLPLVALAFAFALRNIPARRGERARAPRAAGVPRLRLLRNRSLGAASGAMALSNLAMYVTLLGLPILLTAREGFDPAEVGLLLACSWLAVVVTAPFGGRLVDRLGSRGPGVAGLSLQAGALIPLALAPAELGAPAIAASMVAAGIGIGLSSSALQVAALGSVDRCSAGAASGVFSTSRYAGGIAGSLLLAGPLAPAAAGTGGFGLLFAVMAIVAAGSAALALLLPSRRRAPAPQRTAGGLPAPAPAR